MTGALPTNPPRQLSRPGTNPGNDRQCKATKPGKKVNYMYEDPTVYMIVDECRIGPEVVHCYIYIYLRMGVYT